MKVLIPYRAEKTKSSLSAIFDEKERKKLSELMLWEISKAITKLDSYIVSPDFEKNLDSYKIYKSPIRLNKALNDAIEHLELPVLILPSDIPLIKKEDIDNILGFEEDIVISPGERKGTNALLLRKKIPLNYSGKSFPKHLNAAKESPHSYSIYRSKNIYKDLDKLSDIKKITKELPKQSELKKWLCQLPLPNQGLGRGLKESLIEE
ncbi:2-phospho-L-lactate guanylyltransferase [archaeon SCG-AAA382B04]|nr:2-phospho-L-lactate guanylyltransferase [archaeon SCG-AAA382B04]